MCSLAALNTLEWNTCRASSSVVMSVGCFFFFGMVTFMNELIEQFGNDELCRRTLEHLRWPKGVTCPACKSDKISRIFARDQFDCDSCRYQFSATAGTIFHDSHLPLTKWFLATYIVVESKKGISANQLKRMLSISYKTAWYLCHRIRKAMEEASSIDLTGTVELDESYIGGKRRHVGSGNLDNKTMMLGALARGGEVRLRVEKRQKAGIADEDTMHDTANHHVEEWVRGDVQEGVWSLFKRSIVGSYHQVSAKHLDAYLDEFEWRFNQRNNPHLFRDILVRMVNTPKMRMKELIEPSESV